MKNNGFVIFSAFFMLLVCQSKNHANQNYPVNPHPFVKRQLFKLPLGTIKPEGWLKSQLVAQANGLTGHLDEFWPDIKNSAWKGGDGESWERGPYYLDGLLPLAYILDDERLKRKVQPFIEWILDSRKENGWFGPGKSWERWPLAITCKVLSSYYEATGDARAIDIMSGYFRFLYQNPPDWPDDSWRGVRAMEHAVSGAWLYRLTQDSTIVETLETIYKNSYDWTRYYETFPWDEPAVRENRIPHNWGAEGLTAHVVNNAMALKYPGFRYQQVGEERFKQAVYSGLEKYEINHSQVGGRFSGDEHLSGRRPTQGTELCAVVELMFSLEKLIELFADVHFADRLEELAYNSLPGTMTPDCWAHQYDQQSNQVLVSVAERNWSTNGKYSNIYGLMPNYPCCLANFHQGWPKFVEHLWYATQDNGLAAMTFGPCQVTALVGDSVTVNILETTRYPFSDSLTFTINLSEQARFPLYFRIPNWTQGATIQVNSSRKKQCRSGALKRLERTWRDGDVITLTLPMNVTAERRYNSAVAIRRGPLYFALRIEKEYERIHFKENSFYSIDYQGSADWQIKPKSPWNYGLVIDPEKPGTDIKIDEFLIHEYPFGDRGDMVYWREWDSHVTWQHEAPLVLKAPGKLIKSWGLENHSAADPPKTNQTSSKPDTVELVPYGCTRLRIAEFPVVSPDN